MEDEIPDRMISPVPVLDTPDLQRGVIFGSKVVYVREDRQ